MKLIEIKREEPESLRAAVKEIAARVESGVVRDLVIAWQQDDGQIYSSSVCRLASGHIALCEIAKYSVLRKHFGGDSE